MTNAATSLEHSTPPDSVSHDLRGNECTTMRFPIATALLLTMTGLSACSIPVIDRVGTRHYVILGFGVVSVPSPDPHAPIAVAKVQALGIVASDAPGPKLSVGYINNHNVSVRADAPSALVEISDSIAGPTKISVSQPDERGERYE